MKKEGKVEKGVRTRNDRVRGRVEKSGGGGQGMSKRRKEGRKRQQYPTILQNINTYPMNY